MTTSGEPPRDTGAGGGAGAGASSEPRDAATVVVVRERGGAGIELFCVERHARSGFMGGAIVFPGGKVDLLDRHPDWTDLTTALPARVRALGDDVVSARGFAVAALREALEEAAILPVFPRQELLDGPGAAALRLEAARTGLAAALRQRGLKLETSGLEAISRWVTPTIEPRRFDARFFLLAAPEGQDGAHDDHETTRSFWASPGELLSRWERAEIILAPPTHCTVSLFEAAHTVEDAFAIARRQELEPIEPRFIEDAGNMVLVLPGDPLFPGPRSHAGDARAATRFVLEGGRLIPGRAR